MQCDVCGREIKRGVLFDGRLTCRECLLKRAGEGNVCPVCGATITVEHRVSMPLTMVGGPFAGRNAIAIVCPDCHAIFLDDFHYKLLAGQTQ